MVAYFRVLFFAGVLTAWRGANATQPVDASLQALLNRHQVEPGNALLCEQIGVSYTRLNAFEKAAEFFREAIRLNPERIPARKNLGTVLWFLGQREESVAIFRVLAPLIPTDPVPQLYLALSAYDHKNLEMAAAYFEHAGTLASDNQETLPFVIESYLATGRFRYATQLLERRVAAGVSDSKTYRWLGEAYDGQAYPEKAFQAYTKAIEIGPTEAENYLALAGFSIAHANPSFAREVLSRGLQQTSRSPKLLLEIGLAWGTEGNFEKARQAFEDATMAEPDWPMPLLALGVTELQTGNAEHAAEYFYKAERAAPDDYRCYYLHALALNRSSASQNASARETAISELRHAIQLNPLNVQSRIALAQSEISDGRRGEADTELREALRIEPGEPTALYKLALLCRSQGKTQEAARLLKSFQRSKRKSHSEENEFVLILRTLR